MTKRKRRLKRIPRAEARRAATTLGSLGGRAKARRWRKRRGKR